MYDQQFHVLRFSKVSENPRFFFFLLSAKRGLLTVSTAMVGCLAVFAQFGF